MYEMCSRRCKKKYSSICPLKITYYNFSGFWLVGFVFFFFFCPFREEMEVIAFRTEVRKRNGGPGEMSSQ